MAPSRFSHCRRQLFIVAAVSFIALSIVSAADPRLLNPRAQDHENDDYEFDDPEESASFLSTSVKQDTMDERLYPVDLFSEAHSEHRQSQAPPSVSPLPSLAGSSSHPSSIDNDNSGSIPGTSDIDPRGPASRLTMLKPKLNQANPVLFPIGSRIDLEWAFDQKTLLVPPRSLTLEAALVSDASRVWPIANISGSATSAIWDTTK
ncbi:hypothetical protein BGZ67_007118, partial [Mortierella alpina]